MDTPLPNVSQSDAQQPTAGGLKSFCVKQLTSLLDRFRSQPNNVQKSIHEEEHYVQDEYGRNIKRSRKVTVEYKSPTVFHYNFGGMRHSKIEISEAFEDAKNENQNQKQYSNPNPNKL